MNKKLINLAVAAAMVAPAAAMADATLYGILHQSIDYIDQDDIVALDVDGQEIFIGDGFSGWSVNRADGAIIGSQTVGSVIRTPEGIELGRIADVRITNGPAGPSNRVGVKGSEDLGNGLKAVYQVEFGVTLSDRDFTATNGDRGNGLNMRNSFVGLAGGFGTFLVGRHDTPFKISSGKLDMFADTMGDYNGALGFVDLRADNTVTYISPSWSGFQFAGTVIPGGGATVEGGRSIDSDSLAEAYSLAAIYSNGPWYASAAYESLGSDMSRIGTLGNEEADLAGLPDPFDDNTKWRIGLGILDWNGFSLTGIYEDRSNQGFVDGWDNTSWQVQAGYAFGNNMIKGSYGALDRDLDEFTRYEASDGREILGVEPGGDLNQWTIAFDHNFSKRTKVYALYNNVDDDFLPDWDGFSLGLVHKF